MSPTNSKSKLNSPWNIAVDFKVSLSFSQREIGAMLTDYSQDRGIKMDVKLMSERIFYYTSGYPYLVSKLCKWVDEEILPMKKKKEWQLDDIELAFQKITYGGYSTTLFDSLTKALENDKDLMRMIFDISINGVSYDFNINAPMVNNAFIHGIIRDRDGTCHIHNRVFEQRLYGYFLSKQATEKGLLESEEDPGFIKKNGLDLRLVLQKFQQFMKENYAFKDGQFLEREGRLLFLSFLRPILNGRGFAFKEPVEGDERRMDVVITFMDHRYVVELKRWRGKSYHQKGLQQLHDYLDVYSLQIGYLLIFDFRKTKSYKEELMQVNGKEVFGVWV